MKPLLGILIVLGTAVTGTAYAATMLDLTVKKLVSTGIEMVTGPSSTPPRIGWTMIGGLNRWQLHNLDTKIQW